MSATCHTGSPSAPVWTSVSFVDVGSVQGFGLFATYSATHTTALPTMEFGLMSSAVAAACPAKKAHLRVGAEDRRRATSGAGRGGRHGRVGVERNGELDDSERQQHEDGQDQRELDHRRAPLVTSAGAPEGSRRVGSRRHLRAPLAEFLPHGVPPQPVAPGEYMRHIGINTSLPNITLRHRNELSASEQGSESRSAVVRWALAPLPCGSARGSGGPHWGDGDRCASGSS